MGPARLAPLLFLLLVSLFSVCSGGGGDSLDGGVYEEAWAIRNVKISGMAYCQPSAINASTVGAYSISDFYPLEVWTNSSLQFFTGYDALYDAVVVSFRGSMDLSNWMSDLSIRLVYPYSSSSSIGVHRGFFEEYHLMLPFLAASLLSASSFTGSTRVLSVGHSAGGAVATLLSYELKAGLLAQTVPGLELLGLYTFGSPRVGNRDFANDCRKVGVPHMRVTHHRDVFPHLPEKVFGYQHTSTEVYYNEDSSEYKICEDEEGEDDECSNQCGEKCKSVEDHMNYINVDMGTPPCSAAPS